MSEYDPDGRRTAVLEIQGMTCASCVARVEKRLRGVEGVDAAVNLATESARVSYPENVDPALLITAVRGAGYDARVRRDGPAAVGDASAARVRRDGPAAVGDASAVSIGARGLDHDHDHGTEHDHGHGTDHDHGHGADHGPDAAGSGGHVHDTADRPGATTLRTRLTVSVVLGVPVVALGMIPALQFPGWQWVSFVLATPILFWGGWPFHRATLVNARHGAATMDTLITLGTFAAYLWSVWALLFGSAGEIGVRHEVVLVGPVHDASALVYFEVVAAVTVFLLLGRVIEQRATRRAGSALRALLELGAKTVELPDGTSVPIEHLAVGDLFVVRPGGTIAADGVVVEGTASLDESMLTGESVPTDASVGSTVTGGTLAAGGRLVVRATSVGSATRLARIARLVEDAQLGKSRVQRLADRVSGVFVPVVIVLAILTLAGWVIAGQPLASGFTAAVAVLIIACPCALGLATPIAVLVGTGRAAQLGVLVTGPEALESAEKVDTVVLDKTGTLTEGRMTLTRVVAASGVDAGEATSLVAAVERASEHPIARAITDAAPSGPVADDVRTLPGRGVRGLVGAVTVFAGRPSYALELGAELPPELAVAVAEGESRGTVVVAGWSADGETPRARAVFEIADTLRPESAAAVAELQRQGLDLVLLTGDNAAIAGAVASDLGIATVRAGVLPEGKLQEIERLRAEGRVVAMVGDGVNDAAALAAADLGIAMGGGADAAMHAGDVTLVRNDPRAIVTALRISKRTMRVIRGNLFWAFAYNVAALPLAVLGLLNPMLAGAAMAFSSVFVVLNSLRLRSIR